MEIDKGSNPLLINYFNSIFYDALASVTIVREFRN